MTEEQFESLLQEYDDASESQTIIWRTEYDNWPNIAGTRARRDRKADRLRGEILSAYRQTIKEQ